MVEMHGNTRGVANREVVFDCRCGPNDERRATPPATLGRSLQSACGLNASCDLGSDAQRAVDGADVLSDCA
jgi:hypothetical protein